MSFGASIFQIASITPFVSEAFTPSGYNSFSVWQQPQPSLSACCLGLRTTSVVELAELTLTLANKAEELFS